MTYQLHFEPEGNYSSHLHLASNHFIIFIINPLRAAVEKSQQCGTSLLHRGRENSTEKHQPVSEGISWEPSIVSSHTAPQKIAKK